MAITAPGDWIGRVAAAVFAILVSLISPFKNLATQAFFRLHRNPADESLPIHVGDREPSPTICDRKEAVARFESWAKLNLTLSCSAIIGLLSVSSSLINEYFLTCAAYAIGVFVAFLLSLFVYCLSSYLWENMNKVLLFVSSLTIAAAFALILLVVLKGHANATPSVSHGL